MAKEQKSPTFIETETNRIFIARLNKTTKQELAATVIRSLDIHSNSRSSTVYAWRYGKFLETVGLLMRLIHQSPADVLLLVMYVFFLFAL